MVLTKEYLSRIKEKIIILKNEKALVITQATI